MTAPPDPSPEPAARPRRWRRWLLLSVLLVVAAVVGWIWWQGRGRESTDDAFLAADVHPITARVGGRLAAVPVHDNQLVEPGQLLAQIDDDDYRCRREQQAAAVALAEAQLREASLQLAVLQQTTASAVAEAEAGRAAAAAAQQRAAAALQTASTEAGRAAAEAQRFRGLSEQAVSRQRLQDLEAATTAAAASEQAARQQQAAAAAELTAAEAKLQGAAAERGRVGVAEATVARRRAELQAAAAALREADLQLSYTRIVAPARGYVTRKLALPGSNLQPGQLLMTVVGTEVWVLANFKETQLSGMRPGQHASVHVDAYELDLDAVVDSIQAGSGAAFSLLPPENATGNFVKVVQRVPVKLVLQQQPDPQRYRLGPGMSVVPTVLVP